MSDVRERIAVKPGYFTVPDDPAAPPEVIVSRCTKCDEYFFPTRLVCAKCLSRETEETTVAARGTLYSFTFVHIPLFGSTKVEHQEGYGVGQIDLPEGPRLQLPLAGAQSEFEVGQQVVGELATLREQDDMDLVLLRFKPVEG